MGTHVNALISRKIPTDAAARLGTAGVFCTLILGAKVKLLSRFGTMLENPAMRLDALYVELHFMSFSSRPGTSSGWREGESVCLSKR